MAEWLWKAEPMGRGLLLEGSKTPRILNDRSRVEGLAATPLKPHRELRALCFLVISRELSIELNTARSGVDDVAM
jgi:hypothetical protein